MDNWRKVSRYRSNGKPLRTFIWEAEDEEAPAPEPDVGGDEGGDDVSMEDLAGGTDEAMSDMGGIGDMGAGGDMGGGGDMGVGGFDFGGGGGGAGPSGGGGDGEPPAESSDEEEEDEEEQPPSTFAPSDSLDAAFADLFADFEAAATAKPTTESRKSFLHRLCLEAEGKSRIDVGIFASELSRVIKNYTSLLDIPSMLYLSAAKWLEDRYDAKTVDSFKKAMSAAGIEEPAPQNGKPPENTSGDVNYRRQHNKSSDNTVSGAGDGGAGVA